LAALAASGHKMFGLLLLPMLVLGDLPCQPRDFGHSSHVCVCNSTYCDEYDPVVAVDGQILHYVSDRPEGRRLEKSLLAWDDSSSTVGVTITLDRDVKYQKIIGFGGAFTDAAGINIAHLTSEAQESLIRAYYSEQGSEYGLGRVNIGGCDFSDRPYTYCDTEGDVELATWALERDDTELKIPYMNMAKEVASKDLKMYGSPWSAPAWMKSNNALNGQGYLLPEYYQTWADYYVKFLNAYSELGVDMWGLTAQNEPVDGEIDGFTFNCMGWNASTQATWIGEYLGPTLEAAGYGHLQLMAFDDQRPYLPVWADTIMASSAAQYVAGWAVHWYTDFLGLPGTLDRVQEMYPDKFILFTEACTGSYPWELQKVLLGSWERGQEYTNDIIENLNHFSTGWTDWNLVLDMNGGPNWANNFVDAPIIVNRDTDEFYKQPMYYSLAHFSKFIPEDSYRVGLSAEGYDADRVQMVGLERPDGRMVVVVTNRHTDQRVKVRLVEGGKSSEPFEVGPQSVHSLLW